VPGLFRQRGSARLKFTKPRLFGGSKLWIDGDDTGGFVIGPPRSGKGASLIIPNCLEWPDSLIVLDMRGETYDATAGYRSRFSKVVRFSPADENGNTETYNPLDYVSPDPDQRDLDIKSIAAALLPTPKTDTYWIEDGRALFSGIVAYVLDDPQIPASRKNLGEVLEVISGVNEGIREWLTRVAGPGQTRPSWVSRFALSQLSRFAEMSGKQFDGVHGSVMAAISPFQNERILRATSTSSFDLRTLRREKISIYLDFRIQQVKSIGPIFNIFMTQFMDHMSRAMPKKGDKRILVLLDEFQNLGKLENALTVATVLGGFGIPTWFFVQSLRSLDNVYTREGRQTLVNAARAQIFLGAQDPEDQKYVSDLLGQKKEIVKDKSQSWRPMEAARQYSIQEKLQTMPLMRPDEVGSLRDDLAIIKLRGRAPIMSLRNNYYADKKLAPRAWRKIKKTISKIKAKPIAKAAAPTLVPLAPVAAAANTAVTPSFLNTTVSPSTTTWTPPSTPTLYDIPNEPSAPTPLDDHEDIMAPIRAILAGKPTDIEGEITRLLKDAID
jgi:type IV secretion system protein VirD4